MGTEVEPNLVVEKSKYFNRLDEAFGIFSCLWLLIYTSMSNHAQLPMRYGPSWRVCLEKNIQ
jgi:hypothetical protein